MSRKSPVARLLNRSRNPAGMAVFIAVAWIAGIDGVIDSDELSFLKQLARDQNIESEMNSLISHLLAGKTQDLIHVFSRLREIHISKAPLVLDLAIGVALADGKMVTPENHGLRLIADVVGLGEQGLNRVFQQLTGQAFPVPSDLSDPAFWTRKTKQDPPGGNGANAESQSSNYSGRYTSEMIARLKDLAALGLDEDADMTQIREAYRRFSKIHHPDRYASLGEEAVAQATHTFRRIQSAYERLSK